VQRREQALEVDNALVNNRKIKRTVTRLPDGIRTVTESEDPQVA